MAKIYGIDVSHHQGTINWKQTASELRRVNGGTSPGFAILRVGYSARHGKGGLWMDSQWTKNVEGCEAYGVPMGVYVYSYDTSPEAAAITARQVVNQLRGHIWDYPIYLDVEYEPYNTGKDGSGRSRTQVKADNTAIIKAALDVFEKAGYYAAVYCSRDFFLNYTNLGNLAGFDKWEAAYTRSDTAAVENGLWQYSSKNALGIAGFGSSLDCDVSYKDYPDIMKRCGLNGYIKTPASSTGNTNGEKVQTPTVGPMSKGDFDRIVNQAAALGKAPTEYTVRLAPMATTQAAQIKATANELGIPYLSAWVEG